TFNLSNITVQNCNIQSFRIGINVSSAVNISLFNNNVTNSTDGIRLNNTARSVLENNTANVTSGIGLFLRNSSNNTINFGNFSANAGTSSLYGIYLLSSRNNVLNNNKGQTAHNEGILLFSSSNNNILTNNTGTANNNNGIDLDSSSNNNLTGNTGTANNNNAISLSASSNNNILTNNTGTANNNGIILDSNSNNNVLMNNTFKGHPAVFVLTTSNNNNFTNTTIVDSNTGFEINESTNILITNSSFQNTNWSIKAALGSNFSLIDNERMTNYSFNTVKPTITITGAATLQFVNFITANGTNLSMDINLSSNRTFVNTTRSQGLNATANITLFNLVFNNPQVIVSFTDTTFELCNATICREQSYDGNGYKFNISHFTIFAINETQPITLFTPVNDSWINITNNITFDWSDSFGAVTYVINVSTNDTFTAEVFNLTVTGDSNATNNTAILTQNITHYWFVTAFDEIGNKTNSSINTFRIDATPPSVAFADRTPANGSFGPFNILFNWTVIDNINTTLTCYPTINGTLQSAVTSNNNSATNTTLTVTRGRYNLSVTCFDNANANVTNETRLYIAVELNITNPLNRTIVRPDENITINVSELNEFDFFDQINLTINNETTIMSAVNAQNWTGTFIIRNETPRILNVTALGYNISRGAAQNTTTMIELRLDRPVGQAGNITELLACSNQTYVLNNTNVTLTTIYDLDTLQDSVNLSVTNVSGLVSNLTANAQVFNFGTYQIETNYSFIALEEGQYNITSVITTIANQTFNSSFILDNTRINTTLNITGANVSQIIIRDVCGKNTINQSIGRTSLLMPNNSKWDIQVDFGDPVTLNLTPTLLNNSNSAGETLINVSTDYERRTNETLQPTGFKRVAVWDNNITNARYDNVTVVYNYEPIVGTIANEPNLQLYRCDDINSCNLSRQNATLRQDINKVVVQYPGNNISLARFMLVEPGLANQTLVRAPIIEQFNISRKYAGVNELVNITLVLNFSIGVSNVTLLVDNNVTTPQNITTIIADKQFIYYFNYTPSSTGTFSVIADVRDQNALRTNQTKLFFVNSRSNTTLSADGFDSLLLKDIESDVIVLNATPASITTEITPGQYDTVLTSTTLFFNITLKNTTITAAGGNLFTTNDFRNIDVNTPLNRTIKDKFRLRSTATFNTAELVYAYTNLGTNVSRPQNLEVYKCAEADLTIVTPTIATCSLWTLVNGTVVDTNSSTLTQSFSDFSLYSLAEATSTETTTVTTTRIIQAGGGVATTKKIVGALSFITPRQPLVMESKDQITSVFIIKNTGKLTLQNIQLDASTDTRDLSLRLERTEIASLAPGEEVPVKLFIESHTEPAVYEITITARVPSLGLVQTSKVYITLKSSAEIVDTKQVISEIKVAQDILQQNPRCLELKEFLTQSESALKERKFEKARALASAAIEGCQELLAISAELEKPVPLIDLEKFKNYLLMGLAIVSLLFVITGYLLGRLHFYAQKTKEKTEPLRVEFSPKIKKTSPFVGKITSLVKKEEKKPVSIERKKTHGIGYITKRLEKQAGMPFYTQKTRKKIT
ncbi:right-handed parallel beta-helix repeat-containing protein, partial [Candidatus Woesearchaeota archaeon]|nr:right-handed parallel beta-helix repeat-containing protein [Candidatus Woesearchaeota archaeon]